MSDTPQSTVRVRILVATDRKGYWIAYGFAGETGAEEIKQAMAMDDVESGEIYHWVEADVPLPAEAGPAIEGVVHAIVEEGSRLGIIHVPTEDELRAMKADATQTTDIAPEIVRLEMIIATMRSGLRVISRTDDAGQSMAQFMRFEAQQTLRIVSEIEDADAK